MSGIRPEAARDIDAVRRVHTEAFCRSNEAGLVDALWAAGALRVALVAVEDGAIVGHIAFAQVAIRGGASVLNVLGLAPVAVLPARQCRGIGSRLVQAGMTVCGETPCSLILVLGAPAFDGRFGPLGTMWEHGGPPDAFMVQALRRGMLPGMRGVVACRPEFDGL